MRSWRSWPLLLLVGHASSFECDGTTIPDAQVNDDFCDCADGSDELQTGACTNSVFECACTPHQPKKVFASRVNDGVCDCCDGADEWRSGACPNTCVDEAKAQLEVAQRASLRRARREASGRAAAEERHSRLSEARATLAAGTSAVEAARASVAAAEAVEATRRATRDARLASGEVRTALKLEELGGELLDVLLARVALANLVSGVDALYEMLKPLPAIADDMADVDAAGTAYAGVPRISASGAAFTVVARSHWRSLWLVPTLAAARGRCRPRSLPPARADVRRCCACAPSQT